MKKAFVARAMMVLWLTFGSALFARATPLDFGIWYEFSQNGSNPAMGCPPADPDAAECIPSSGTPTQFVGPSPWTFVAPHRAFLTVTDAFDRGDVFDIREGGVLVGTTSTPIGDTSGFCGDDPASCLADPTFSHGVFDLGKGARSVTIFENAADALPFGVAYFRVDIISEPHVVSLLLPLLLVLARQSLAESRAKIKGNSCVS
jgi:hypothetical protein